jgi:hypothetical protein
MFEIKKTIKKGQYVYALVPDHPSATKNGYVLLHRVLIENKIGRLLQKDEEVHHIDFNPKNNSEDNLQLMKACDHRQLHADLKKGRTMVALICPTCKKEFIVPKNQTHLVKGYKNPTCCSRSCRGIYSRRNYDQGTV